MKKISVTVISLVLSVIFVISLSGCGSSTIIESIDPGAEDKQVVGTASGYEILYDELRFITANFRSYMIKVYGDDVFSDTAKVEELKELVTAALAVNAAARRLAEDNGIGITDKEVADYVDIKMNMLAEELSDVLIAGADSEDYTASNDEINAEYRSYLEKNDLTDRYNRYVLSVDGAVEQLKQKFIEDGKLYSDDASVKKYISDNFVHVFHIYIPFTVEGDDTYNAKASADLVSWMLKTDLKNENNRKELKKRLGILETTKESSTVYKFYSRISSAADASAKMKALIGSTYNKDMTITQNGYYFSYGEFDENYEKTAFALSVGEISDPVATENGYYIIQRLEHDESYINTNFDALKDQYHAAYINAMITEIKEKNKFAFNDFGASLDLVTLK